MKFTIELPPITKKNHQQIVKAGGRLLVIPSKQYKDYEKACEAFMPDCEIITAPITLKCIYHMPTRRRVDITNLLQATCDVLVKYKVIEDDNNEIVASVDGTRVVYDKEHPCTEVEITPINCSIEDR